MAGTVVPAINAQFPFDAPAFAVPANAGLSLSGYKALLPCRRTKSERRCHTGPGKF
jgi:hypothetical protein